MKSHDYVPRAYDALLIWLTQFLNYVTNNMLRFGLSIQKIEPLQTKFDDFYAAQEQAELPNAGKADRLDREEKAVVVSREARNFVNLYLRFNPAVTDADRVNLGLNVPDPEPTPVPEPVTWPVVILLDSGTIMRLTLHYKDSESLKSQAKPAGVHGAEIRWAILEAPPVTTDDLIHSEFSTRTPHTFIYEENLRGKTVWFRLRWENTRGEKGPWSELYSAIIP
jgi:hypothetical protein